MSVSSGTEYAGSFVCFWRQQRARSPYRCEVCSHEIEVGERHHYQFDPESGAARLHLGCQEEVARQAQSEPWGDGVFLHLVAESAREDGFVFDPEAKEWSKADDEV